MKNRNSQIRSPTDCTHGTNLVRCRLVARSKARTQSDRTHQGFTLTEVIVSVVLLTSMMGVVLPMLARIRTTERLNSQRHTANRAIANVMERIGVWTAEERTPDSIEQLLGAELLELSLPEAVGEVQIDDIQNPSGKRIHLSVSWVFDGTRRSAPSRLTAWFYE